MGPAKCLQFQRLGSSFLTFLFLGYNVRPIAAFSRRYNQQDCIALKELVFIKTEVQILNNDGIIEPSESPWQAQVLVKKIKLTNVA